MCSSLGLLRRHVETTLPPAAVLHFCSYVLLESVLLGGPARRRTTHAHEENKDIKYRALINHWAQEGALVHLLELSISNSHPTVSRTVFLDSFHNQEGWASKGPSAYILALQRLKPKEFVLRHVFLRLDPEGSQLWIQLSWHKDGRS